MKNEITVLVFDEPSVLRCLIMLLNEIREFNFHVIFAPNVIDARALITDTDIDMAIIDMGDVKLEGLEIACMAVNKGAGTPVIVTSPLGHAAGKVEETKYFRFVSKSPFNIVEFLRTVRDLAVIAQEKKSPECQTNELTDRYRRALSAQIAALN
ncbi:MAG: hypothetical protein KBC33_02010 [Candidatus Pacebacteria bacterium]|nr:hypothetical protein [Candidatus Paceibacterota bacterium]